MQEKDKAGVLKRLSQELQDYLANDFRVDSKEGQNYLKSMIFYRSLYNVIFAARHRSDKSLDRTIKELQQILNE